VYRYYYFGGCGHQQTVLFAYCDEAEPLTPAAMLKRKQLESTEQSPLGDTETQPQKRRERKKVSGKAGKQHRRRYASSPTGSKRSHSQHLPHNNLIPRAGSASITEEPLLETSSPSSSPHAQTIEHSSSASVDDMTGLAPFGTTLRSWMSEVASKETHASPSWQSTNSIDETVTSAFHVSVPADPIADHN